MVSETAVSKVFVLIKVGMAGSYDFPIDIFFLLISDLPPVNAPIISFWPECNSVRASHTCNAFR